VVAIWPAAARAAIGRRRIPLREKPEDDGRAHARREGIENEDNYEYD